MKPTSFVVSVLSLVALPVALAQGTIDNSKVASDLFSQAIKIPAGKYTIQNAQSGNLLVSIVNSVQNFFPTTSASGGQTDIIVGDGGNGNSVYFEYSNSKCASAQWDFNGGYDGFVATYACNGQSGSTGTVRPAKQQWLLVPASGSSSSSLSKSFTVTTTSSKVASDTSSSSSSSSGTTCSKPADWINRHPEYVKSADFNHPECASLLDSANVAAGYKMRRSLRKRGHHLDVVEKRAEAEFAGVEKRASSYGPFYIVAVDHLQDMTTRAFSDVAATAFGSQKSIKLVEFDTSDSTQTWTLTPA